MKKHYLWLGLIGCGIVAGITGSMSDNLGIEFMTCILGLIGIGGGTAVLGIWIAEHWEQWK